MANYVMKMPSSFVELSAEEMTYDGGLSGTMVSFDDPAFKWGVLCVAVGAGLIILGGALVATGAGAPAAIPLFVTGMGSLAGGLAFFGFY